MTTGLVPDHRWHTGPVPGEDERERLRQTFDRAAVIYDRVRPSYPEALFDDLVALADLTPGDRLLEVGCATGLATRPLARRGFRITCVELGAELAAVARQNLAEWPVQVVEGQFEEWPPGEPYALVYAATAWHWIDPAVRYQRAWQALRSGGHLAIWAAGHVFPEGGDSFFHEIQDIYDEIGQGQPPGEGRPRPGELPEDDIEASGLFEVIAVSHYDWERVYQAEEYIELLDTFSGHLAMADWKRKRLYGEIRRRLALRRDHSVRRHWGAVLQVARRREYSVASTMSQARPRAGPVSGTGGSG
jgi:SAM-dependent methyltransferase